jgi:hypothetical protein
MALFHKGGLEVDGRYLVIPTPTFGDIRLDDHMSLSHREFRRELSEDDLPRLRPTASEINPRKTEPGSISRERILAGGTAILSLTLPDETSYGAFDPRFAKRRSYAHKLLQAAHLTKWAIDSLVNPRTIGESVVFVEARKDGQVSLIDPCSTPVITEVIDNLGTAVARDTSSYIR